MASRALGAFFALAAAAAIVVSIASSAWWAGTPVVDGREIQAKYVHAGPLGATGCNVGGDGSCEPVSIDQTVQLVGYGELAAAGLATLFLFIVLSAALRVSEHRRGVASASLLFTLLAAGGAGALLYLGPGISAAQHVDVPIGWGTYAFGGGVLASLLASLITRRLEPEPLRLKPGLQTPPAGMQAQPEPIGNLPTPYAPTMQHDAVAPPRMAPSTPALSAHRGAAQAGSSPRIRPPAVEEPIQSYAASSPRIRPPVSSAIDDVVNSFDEPANPYGGSSPRIRPPADEPVNPYGGSSPRIRPPADEPVNPYARTKPPSEPPPDGYPRAPTAPPPRASQPGMLPARTKPPTDAPSRPSGASSSSPGLPGMPPARSKPTDPPPAFTPARSKPTDPPATPPARNKPMTDPPAARSKPMTDPPAAPSARSKPTDPPGMPPARNQPLTDPPAAPSARSKPTDPPGMPPTRNKPLTDPPGAARPAAPSDARPIGKSTDPLPSIAGAKPGGPPAIPRKPMNDVPSAPRGKPTEPPPNPARTRSPSDAPPNPARTKSPSDAPSRPSASSLAAARPSASIIPASLGSSTVPSRPSAPAIGSPSEPPARPSPSPTEPPARPSAPSMPSIPGARPKPPTLSPVRSVVPSPAPGLRGKSIVVPEHLRASTEQGTPPPDPAPVRGSRPGIAVPPGGKTIAHAVPPMPDLDEAVSRRAQTENDDSLDQAMRATEHIDAVTGDDDSDAGDDDSGGAEARPRRSDSEVGTGPNPIDPALEHRMNQQFDRVGEDTAVGLLAAPPAPPLRPGDDAEFNRAGSQAERTGRTHLPGVGPQPDDLMKTIEHNPKTPIPTLRTPDPALEAERRAQVPITTAPTTLPPPKQTDVVPSGPTPACPQCEAPMNWVDEHLRFYCKQCRMYF